MLIEIWSDVVCPWCYIGKRRLERALADFPHRTDVEIQWRSFMLDPGAPTEPSESVAAALGRKYGGGEAAGHQMVARVQAAAAEEGLDFAGHARSLHLNTLDAHRLLHLAGHEGVQGELKEALLAAYFTRGENLADHDVLTATATSIGLPEARVREVLSSDAYADEVWADIERAQSYGASGVPFFVLDHKYGISGAQPAELFARALEQAWTEAHPNIQMVGDGDVCGPDGCAV